MSPISLKRGVYAGAVTAALSLLGAAFVGMIILERSLPSGHVKVSGNAGLVSVGFALASVVAIVVANLILVGPRRRVSRARVAAAVIALTAAVPLCAAFALWVGPHLVGNLGLLLGVSGPTALVVTLLVYLWARTAIPWLNRSAPTPA